jgi:hypothetical protein
LGGYGHERRAELRGSQVMLCTCPGQAAESEGKKDVGLLQLFSLPCAFNHLADRSSLVGLCRHKSGKRPQAGSVNRTQLRAHPLLFSHSSRPLVCISFPHSAHTMSPYNDQQQPHPVIKSESPPLHSVPISSIGQPFSQYSDTGPLFRFGTKEQRVLPPFNFISRPRSSSSFSPHSAMSHLNAYSSTVSGSQSHFAVPPADDPGALTPTDEYDDGDETGDFPSGSGSSSKIDKSVRRRSSKGASRTLYLPPF